MDFRISFLFVIVSVFMIFTIGFESNFAEARGPDEPCSYMTDNSHIKLTYDYQTGKATCKKVDYWVPEICGRIAGLYLTDSSCQPPPTSSPTPSAPRPFMSVFAILAE